MRCTHAHYAPVLVLVNGLEVLRAPPDLLHQVRDAVLLPHALLVLVVGS